MPFSPLTQRPRSLAWSYDAKYLAGGTNSGAIHVLDGATLEIRHTLRGHTGEITAIAWLIDGSRIVSAGMDGYLRWWDVAKGVELFKVSIAEPGNICELSFSADGRWLAGRAEAGKVYVWTIEPQVTTDRRHLARLDLSNATLDTGTIQSLVNMPALKILDVSGTSLGDEVIPQFAKMDRLKSLAVEDTFISAGGVQRLRAALPDTDIQWNARGPDRSIAQRLLAKNAKVSVMMGQQRTYVVSPSDLPEIPFRVVSIKAFGKRQLSVKDFEGLEELDALESIDLLHTGVNDAVLAKVQGLTNLQNIDFGGTIVTGKPLAGFSIMPRVHTVGFGGDLMNVDVAHLNRFPNLKHAWIGWNPYGDTGLANLPLLPELELLVCEHTQIQGSGFPSLNRFQKLRVLNFSDTLVDDEGLQKLPVLPGLTELRLANTSLTDASVLHLSQFTMLKLLDLNGTSLTPSGLAELRKAIPGCTIEWSAAAVKVPVEPVKTPTLAELRAAIEAQPESVEARLRRGKWYRQRHLWGEALADLESALDGVAGTHYWDRSALAALHLHRGNIDAYRKICSELAAELLVTPDDVRLADMVRLVCLSPVGVDDFAPIMEISNTLMAKRDNELFQRNQISVLCRLKLWKEAVEAARAFRTKYQGGLGVAQPMLFQAIAFQNLGETDAARKALIEAKEYAEAQTPNPKDPVDWFSFDALYTEIAFAEASELILGERQELSLKYPAPDLEPPK